MRDAAIREYPVSIPFKSKSRDIRFSIHLNPKSHKYLTNTKQTDLRGFMWKNWMLIELKIDEDDLKMMYYRCRFDDTGLEPKNLYYII